jgi:hypothetical protein
VEQGQAHAGHGLHPRYGKIQHPGRHRLAINPLHPTGNTQFKRDVLAQTGVSAQGGAMYRIKNWRKFQHYGDGRTPPWIKLYTECLDDYKADGTENDFHKLSDTAKLTCMLIWLLASRFNGVIPNTDENWIKSKIGIKKIDIKSLLVTGFIEDTEDASKSASIPASNLATDDFKKHSYSSSISSSLNSSSISSSLNSSSSFQKPTPAEVTEYAKSKGIQLDGEVFCSFYESKGWVVGKSPMKSWKAAVTGTWKHGHSKQNKIFAMSQFHPVPLSDQWNRARNIVLVKLNEAVSQNGDIPRTLSICRDEFRDMPKLNGEDAVTAGYEIFLYQQSKKG